MDLESCRRWEAYTHVKEVMPERSHIPGSPWRVVLADNKKCARLNCVHHLLGQAFYHPVPRSPVLLSECVYHVKYTHHSVPEEIIVPSVYRSVGIPVNEKKGNLRGHPLSVNARLNVQKGTRNSQCKSSASVADAGNAAQAARGFHYILEPLAALVSCRFRIRRLSRVTPSNGSQSPVWAPHDYP